MAAYQWHGLLGWHRRISRSEKGMPATAPGVSTAARPPPAQFAFHFDFCLVQPSTRTQTSGRVATPCWQGGPHHRAEGRLLGAGRGRGAGQPAAQRRAIRAAHPGAPRSPGGQQRSGGSATSGGATEAAGGERGGEGGQRGAWRRRVVDICSAWWQRGSLSLHFPQQGCRRQAQERAEAAGCWPKPQPRATDCQQRRGQRGAKGGAGQPSARLRQQSSTAVVHTRATSDAAVPQPGSQPGRARAAGGAAAQGGGPARALGMAGR